MRFMPPKPGQALPKGMVPPKQGGMGPRKPVTKPIKAQQVTAAPSSRPKGGIGMTGGPKPFNPAIGGGPRPVVGFPGGPGGKTTYSNDPRPVTGVINPGGVPPANASPPPATGGGFYNAMMGRQNPTPPMSAPSNSIANVSTTGFKRSRADFGDIFGMKKGGKVKSFRDGGIYTADMGQPPQDIDGGSAPRKAPAKPKVPTKPKAPPKPVKPMEMKKAKGGSIDGIAQRGKTNCKIC